MLQEDFLHCLSMIGELQNFFMVTDSGLRAAGLLDKLLDLFGEGFEVEVYDSVPPDSSLDVVNEVASLFKEKGSEVIVALGGGSVLDTAKGACMVVSTEDGDIAKVQGVDVVKKRVVPFVAIPTTCGTGSEVTKAAVIEDRKAGRKLAFASSAIYPDVAVLDPVFVETLPAKLVAATSMDALTHAVEAYTCVNKNCIADSLALVAVRLIFANVLRAVEGDSEAKFNLLVAASIAGMAFSNAMVGMVHAVAHAVGSVAGVPHGVANAVLLPHVIRFNQQRCEKTKKLYDELFRFLLLFDPGVVGKSFYDAVNSLLIELHNKCGLPVRLQDAGVKEEQFEEIANQALLDGSGVFNPVAFEKEDVLAILREAF